MTRSWTVNGEWPRILSSNLRATYRSIADKLHPTFTPPSELLVEIDDVLDEDLHDPLRQALTSYYKEWE
ncbi:hypothetical protein JD81_03177 [Micromonospora sagamiensis]|uniref:Uncharacterized protein n=1 Tax=Micromonospora sagamiensis TaxID=47875 RepID=A0A562WHC7_9ACTN|nr:hypothetical protein JD81_03177 [Micromonospora sagamiensis]